MDRREFGRLAAAGLAGLTGLAARPPAAAEPKEALPPGAAVQQTPPGLQRKKKGDLYYRPLGATGLWVSELGLGGSPSPPENIFLAAMDRGVNFCDTSPRYSEGKGERDIGRIVKGRRDQIVIGTKFTPNRDGVQSTADILKQVDASLSRLGTDYVDVLGIHRALGENDAFADWVLEAIERLRKAGKARSFGASVHNSSLPFNQRMIESGHYQVLLIPMNIYFDPKLAGGPDILGRILTLAAQKGVAIVAMKTLAAGGLAKVPTPPGVSAAQAKLRWVLRHPEVSSILNEMVTFEYLKENLAASNAASLSPKEEAYLERCVRQGGHAYCRMCQTCEANCPARLPIPELLRARMYAVDYGDRCGARALAAELKAAAHLDACHRCGRCEVVCPWGVKTSALFDELRQVLRA